MGTPLLRPLSLLLAALLCPHALAAPFCSTLYDAADRIVYRTAEPLVDLSRPLSAQVQQRWPGHHVVLSTDDGCWTTGRLPGRVGAIEPTRYPGRPASLPPAVPAGGIAMDGHDRRPSDSLMLVHVPPWPDGDDDAFRPLLAGLARPGPRAARPHERPPFNALPTALAPYYTSPVQARPLDR